MSRFALLLLGSALMLIVAACDTNGDDDAADDFADDTTTVTTDDETNGTDDVTVEDEDQTQTRDAEVGDDPDSDALQTEEDDTEATDPADEDVASQEDDDMTQDDEAAFEDEDATVDDEELAEPDEGEIMDPNQGMFFDLTFEEANDMTEFDLREPENVPEALELQMIIGMASMTATPEEQEEDEAETIVFSYEQPPDEEMMQGLPVEFTQSTEIDMSEGLGPDVDSEQITIGEREVTRIRVMQETGDEVIAYAWNEDEVHFSLAAIIGGDVQEEDLEEMIASVPAS